MSFLIAISILACIGTGVGLVIAIRTLAFPRVTLPATTDWIDELSIERYRPMLWLLDDEELRFLRSQRFTREVVAQFRRQRCQIFRGCLRSLSIDFGRICMALKLLMLQANTDRPDLASALIRGQVGFAWGMVVVHAQLVLYTLGIGSVDVTELVKAVQDLFDGRVIAMAKLIAADGLVARGGIGTRVPASNGL
jgi:hypothetical protein